MEPQEDGKWVRIVGHQWSKASHDVKDYLARYRVPYRWVEAGSGEARYTARSADAEAERLPLVIFPDGTVLSEPSEEDLAEKLGLVVGDASPFHDLVIVGGGPAGLAAAVYAASEGLRTMVVEKGAPGGQAGTSARIENFLGFPEGISGGDLARRSVEQAKGFGTEFLAAHEATQLRSQGPYRVVTLDDGADLFGYAVLIATGVDYRRLEASGAERLVGRGIYYGAASAEANVCRGREVCVLGGGNSAGQAAMFLSRYARRVHVLTVEGSLEISMSQYLAERIHATENIQVHPHTTVTEVQGEDHLRRVILTNDETEERAEVTTSALFVFIGATPRTRWLSDVLERDDDGFICSGSGLEDAPGGEPGRSPFPLETSLPGVFVAGDVRAGSVKRVVAAAGEGAAAIQYVHRYLAEL